MPSISKIHYLFEIQAEEHPNRIAVSLGDQALTYAELNAKANQLAFFILDKGINPGSFIPIYMEKSIDTVITILAILKAGSVYIPISIDASESMLYTILENSGAQHILTTASLIHRIEKVKINRIELETIEPHIKHFPENNIKHEMHVSDNAYVLYTSGTTGLPKGVLVTHQNLLHTYFSWDEVYQLSYNDIHLQMANPAFDVFTGDLIRALCSGAELVLCPKNILLRPKKLGQLILQKKISCAEFVPAILRTLLNYLEESNMQINSLRLLLCGSDVWTMDEFRRTKKRVGTKTRVINTYGLTEATIDSTYFEESEENGAAFLNTDLVPIGKPFPHVMVHVLNHDHQSLSVGEIGELYIGGKGVAEGYLGQAQLTAERFIMSPIENHGRLYKTGDFARRLKDDTIEFLGRNQTHVKINGQRVELLALDATITQHEKIKYSISYSSAANKGHPSLQCVILPTDDSVSFEELISHIKQHLPYYYVPQRFFIIDELVLTLNGKIDRAIESQRIVRELVPTITPAQTDIEKKLTLIWKKILGLDVISTHSSFYDLGGSSLSFLGMLEVVNRELNTTLSYCEDSSTIEKLSKQITHKREKSDKQDLFDN